MAGHSPKTNQLLLQFSHRPALDREDFWVSASNQQAVAWIDQFPNWPAPGLIIVGSVGSGKTHLAQVWQKKTGAIVWDKNQSPDDQVQKNKYIVIDNITPITNPENILHLYNLIAAEQGSLLITAPTPPAQWNIKLADLSSRLLALPVVEITPPDDQLLSALLIKLADDRQISLSPEIIQYVLPRMERSFLAAQNLIEKLDHLSLAEKRNITVPVARAVLEAMA